MVLFVCELAPKCILLIHTHFRKTNTMAIVTKRMRSSHKNVKELFTSSRENRESIAIFRLSVDLCTHFYTNCCQCFCFLINKKLIVKKKEKLELHSCYPDP